MAQKCSLCGLSCLSEVQESDVRAHEELQKAQEHNEYRKRWNKLLAEGDYDKLMKLEKEERERVEKEKRAERNKTKEDMVSEASWAVTHAEPRPKSHQLNAHTGIQ